MDLALHLAAELARVGVQEVCLCAGARNSPLVSVFSELPQFRVYHFFEERSASFFALGRIKSQDRPVAVVTTSGTAVAELLPAAMEAHYTGLPLILVTADRPRKYRGTGAPQSVEQVGIFGPYAHFVCDWAVGDSEELKSFRLDGGASETTWDRRGPAQINVCFEEPLLDRALTILDLKKIVTAALSFSSSQVEKRQATASQFQKLQEFLEQVKYPLVIVGGLSQKHSSLQKSLVQFLIRLGSPVYLEATSGLRECRELEPIALQSTDRILEKIFQPSFQSSSMTNSGPPTPIQGVLRIGGVPTLRFWRDLEGKCSHLPVLSISDCPFPGLTRSECIETDLETFFLGFSGFSGFSDFSGSELQGANPSLSEKQELFADFFAADRKLSRALIELLEQEPLSECGMIHALSKRIPDSSRIYLGNSLPIREWDLAASRSSHGFVFAANRGANGIDGQVSSFLGFSEPGQQNWAFLGDLTTMYDLAAPWILPQLREMTTQLVVVNNGGGKIFSRMFKNPAFQNQHEVSFAPWAALWKMTYEKWEQIPETISASGNRLIELRPDPAATARFWAAYDRLCQDC